MNHLLWPELVAWVKKIVSGQQTAVGIDIERRIEVYIPNSKNQAIYKEKLAMILLFAKEIEDKEILEKVILEYLWDEWLSNDIQFQYTNQYPTIASEIILQSGSTKVYRFINPNTNEVYLLCEDGQKCSSGIIDAFSKIIDPIKQRKALKKITGSLYGYVVPKRGTMVFKTNQPHDEGKNPGRGQECGIVTATGQHANKLTQLKTELEKVKSKKIEIPSFEIINANRGCTILDLLLRYMDIIQVGGKRWFFRSLSAYYSGHRGLVSSSTVNTEKSKVDTKGTKKKA
jgi:hypothetical protein